jgi:hypothetical protein
MNKLQAYQLSDQQWELADDLIEVLMVHNIFLDYAAMHISHWSDI